MNRRTLLAGGVFALCSLPALAQDKTYTLQPKFTAGEILKYRLVMNVSIKLSDKGGKPVDVSVCTPSPPPQQSALANARPNNQMKMNMSATLVQRTKAVKPNGGATLASQLRNGKVVMMGQSEDLPAAPETMSEMDKTGNIIKVDGAQSGAAIAGNPFMGVMQMDKIYAVGVVYPEKPVKAGDKWEQELPGGVDGATIKVSAEAITGGLVNSKETILIKQSVSIPVDMNVDPQTGEPSKDKKGMAIKGSMTAQTTYRLFTADSRIVSASGKLKGAVVMQFPAEMAALAPALAALHMDIEGVIGQTLISTGKTSGRAATSKPYVKLSR